MKTLVLIVALAFAVSGQQVQPCTLTLNESPNIRGLKLGMTEAEAVKLGIPETFKLDFMEPLIREVSFIPSSSDPRFENIGYISLDFYDNRLMKIHVSYPQRWRDIAEFAVNFSPKLPLPVRSWSAVSFGKNYAIMRCDGFEALLSADTNNFPSGQTGGNSTLTLTDTGAEKQIKEQNAKADESRKSAIKP